MAQMPFPLLFLIIPHHVNVPPGHREGNIPACPSKGITNKQSPQLMKAFHFPSKDTLNFLLIHSGAAEEMTAPPGEDFETTSLLEK